MLRFRKEQMDVLSEYMRHSFEKRMVEHIAEEFPDKYRKMQDPERGDAKVHELVREGMGKAEGYGLTSERDVALFIDVMVRVSPDFDQRPDMDWACEILKSDSVPPDGKLDAIHEELDAREAPPEDEEQ